MGHRAFQSGCSYLQSLTLLSNFRIFAVQETSCLFTESGKVVGSGEWEARHCCPAL